MSDEEMCEAYDLDPNGPDTFEACDRIEQLLRYRSMDYLERIDFDRQSARELDFERERLFATQTEIWAYERGFEKLCDLAAKVNERLVTLGRFSLRLARQVALEVSDEFEAEHDLRDWATRLQDGDFHPDEVIATINRIAQSASQSGEIYAEAFMEGLYPFMAELMSDAQTRFDGRLGEALEARFHCPPGKTWGHYRGVSFFLWQDEAGGYRDGADRRVHITLLAAPPCAPNWAFPPTASQADALVLLRSEVDAFWRQNPPMHPDNNNAQ